MTESTIDKIIGRMRSDSKYFKETQLRIKTKDKRIIPFKLNNPQLKLQGVVDKLRAENKPVRIILLKSRQFGGSTWVEGEIYHATTMYPNVSSAIIAHNAESTNNLFNISKLFWETQDKEIRPKRKRCNRTELIFQNPSRVNFDKNPGLRSYIRIETAGNKAAGRSWTLQNLHVSEIAFWDNPESVMTGLNQAVPSEPGTMIVIESSANGLGNYFYDMWEAAVKGNNDYTPVFVGWNEDETCRKEPPKDFEPYDYNHKIYGNEKELAVKYDLDNWQLYWRRYTIRNNFNNNIDEFHQEFPITPEEAFLRSGRNVFSIDTIQRYYEHVKLPARGQLDVKDDYKTFIQTNRGKLNIWEEPQANFRYAVGIDVAEGFATGDFSCAEVFDVRNYEQCAEWHGHIGQEDFAEILERIGKYYNRALLVVESNQGQTVLSYLKHYPRLYYRRKPGVRGEKPTREFGFRTTGKTKGMLIADFKKLFEADELIINGRELLQEMKTYVEEAPDESGNKRVLKVMAEGNKNDDRIMAAMLAIQGLKVVPAIIVKDYVSKTKKNPNYKRDVYTGV